MSFKVLTACILLISFNAIAQKNDENNPGVYISGGIVPITLKAQTYSYDLGTTYPFFVGYNFNKNLSAEFMFASASTANYSTTLNFSAVYLKPILPISNNAELFARLGSNNMNLTTTYTNITQRYASYGGGATFYFADEKKGKYISIDYMVWGQEGTLSLVSPGVTFGMKF